MTLHHCFSIMRFTWLELSRVRLWWFVCLLVLAGCGLAEFGAALAVTESGDHRLAFYAAAMRLGAVFAVALFVAASVLREFDDKAVDAVLSRPVSRADWYCGRLLGYAVAAAAIALVTSVPLALQVPQAAAAWGFSLAFELVLVSAATLAFAITVRQLPVAVCAVAGFYLLSRGIAAFSLIATGPTVDPAAPSNQVITMLVEALAYLLPALDRFTATEWLTGGLPAPAELGFIAMQTAIYAVLLAAVGLFDLYRRNF